ncbi:unnamed protein product [Chrysoparadoxa australica]
MLQAKERLICFRDPVNDDEEAAAQDGSLYHLKVTVIRAENLLAGDVFASDPYVFLAVTNSHVRHRTSIKKATLNPEWNESFEFAVDTRRAELACELFDYDHLMPDDALGHVNVRLDDPSIPLNCFVTKSHREVCRWWNVADGRGRLQLSIRIDLRGRLHVTPRREQVAAAVVLQRAVRVILALRRLRRARRDQSSGGHYAKRPLLLMTDIFQPEVNWW